MLSEMIVNFLKDIHFEDKVEEELKKQGKELPKGIVVDWAAILAIVLPIVIKLLVEYVVPFLINKGIPWIIEQIKKRKGDSGTSFRDWLKAKF